MQVSVATYFRYSKHKTYGNHVRQAGNQPPMFEQMLQECQMPKLQEHIELSYSAHTPVIDPWLFTQNATTTAFATESGAGGAGSGKGTLLLGTARHTASLGARRVGDLKWTFG